MVINENRCKCINKIIIKAIKVKILIEACKQIRINKYKCKWINLRIRQVKKGIRSKIKNKKWKAQKMIFKIGVYPYRLLLLHSNNSCNSNNNNKY